MTDSIPNGLEGNTKSNAKSSTKDAFVGVFDSGIGGISVLKRLVTELPYERFVFYGDSAHAPYGSKTPQQVQALSGAITDTFVDEGAKAIVIACNTATAAAAQMLRERYPQLPIVGVEPALKPAALAYPQGRIIVMATARTLSLSKFLRLEAQWGATSQIIPVAGTGIVELIEAGKANSSQMHDLLEKLIGQYRGTVDAVVLGCTHYPFITRQIRAVLGDVDFCDGGTGAAQQLHRLLKTEDLLAQEPAAPFDTPLDQVEFRSSIVGSQEIELYKEFFLTPIEAC